MEGDRRKKRGENISKYIVVAVGGLAKNTGKTTTIKKLISELQERKTPFLLTGIGYDGEAYDLITGLPKPRYLLEKGALLLTSVNPQGQERKKLSIIQELGLKNSLGKVVLAEVKERDHFLLAGPNRGPDLEKALESISLGNNVLTLVDGAINRLVPLSISSSLILALGASYSTNLDYLSKTAASLYHLFSLREGGKGAKSECPDCPPIISLTDQEGEKEIPYTSLFASNVLKRIKAEARGRIKELRVPGIMSSSIFEEVKGIMEEDGRIWFKNPFVLLATNSAIYWKESFCKNRIKVSFFQCPRLVAFTVNPFYPFYEKGRFTPRYLDADLLRERIATSSPLLVFDVVKYPKEQITDHILRNN